MRQVNNAKGKVEIVLTTFMLAVGGSLLKAQTPHDTSYTANYPCAGYEGCPSSGVVKLKFTPKAGAHGVRWQTILTASTTGATRIGTVSNVDIVKFPPLDLAAGSSSAGLFIGQIGPDPVTDRGFGIYKVDSQGQRVGQPWWKKAAAEITYCEPQPPTPYPGGRTKAAIHSKDTSHEMGWNCSPLAPSAQSSASNRITSLVAAPRRTQPLSLWISCSGGCCDVGGM